MVFAVFTFAACGPVAPAPQVSGLEPARGWQGEATPVVIQGRHFLPTVKLGEEDPVGGEFEAWLETDAGEVALEGAELVDYDALAAQVPAGVDVGSWPVVVRTPAGDEARLDDAFLVTSTRADHLRLRTEQAAFDLGEYARIELRVEDPNDALVPSALSVEVLATSATGAGGVEFAAGQLGAQAPSGNGVGILGTLDEDGSTELLVRSAVADDVRFVARALDEAGISEGDLLLSWQEGALAGLEVAMPFSPYKARAGQGFTVHVTLLDEFGNPLPETYARLSVTDSCSGYRAVEEVIGEADIDVQLDTACPVDRLTFFNSSVEVESEPFEVLAGDMVAYAVTATPDQDVEAGVQPVLVLVEAVDAWGNAVSDFAEPFRLSDDLSGIDTARTTCPSMTEGSALCTTYLLRAGTDVLRVVDDAARSGASEGVAVVAGDASSLTVALATTRVVAGEPVTLTLGAYDPWGNVVAIEPGGVDPVTVDDDSGSASCDWTGPIGDGRHGFDCTFTTAWEESTVVATLGRLGLAAEASDPLTIVNAALAGVDLTVPSTASAGVGFSVVVAGYDAYGNAYLEQSDPVVDLTDATGTLSPASVTLGADGTGSTTATLTEASTGTRISAHQGGVLLGLSTPVRVTAGSMTGFSIRAPAWVAVGESLEVDVVPVDAYDNLVTTYSGSVALAVTGGACAPATAVLAGDAGSAALECVAVQVGASVTATEGSWSGTSDTVDVVDLTCASPPVAELLLDGEAEPTVCLSGDEVVVDASGGGSTAGAAALAWYLFEDDLGTRARGAGSDTSFTWTGAGVRQTELVVIDADGCAAAITELVWVGEDDGEVAGPVDLSVSASSVVSGASVTVTAVARDCTGDVAANQELLVAADLGVPAGVSTGAGLAVTLDAAGEGTFAWDFPTGHAAIATLAAGSSSAGGFGTVSLAVTDDGERPHVVEVSPSGTTSGSVEEVVILFDEAILASTITAATLTGPSGTVAVTRSLAEDTLTLTLDTPIDEAADGTYTVSVSSSLRDEAGNRLDGDWSGGAATFASAFGGLPDGMPGLAGCTWSADTFRPDGDDGAGEEADEIEVTPSASGTPAWWWLTVEDVDGAHVRSDRALGTSTSVTWDGRGDSGVVGVAGSYLVTLWAVDDYENLEEACSGWVTMEHRLALP